MISYIKSVSTAAVLATGLSFGAATPSYSGIDPFLGEIMMFGGNFCPRGWTSLEGQLLAVNSNQALFSILGTMYGGDGRTTFALPDMRGRMPMGFGNGPGLPPHKQASKGGVATHNATMPAHSHGVTVEIHGTTADATRKNPGGSVWAESSDGANLYSKDPQSLETFGTQAVTVTEKIEGNGGEISNLPPYLATRYCMAIAGTFPSRN